MSLNIKFRRCNLNCEYCYGQKIKKTKTEIDIEAVKLKFSELLPKSHSACLHGGEPLLLPELEYFLSKIYYRFGYSSVQTNLTLLNEDHIRLFQKYKTHVGISLDGYDDSMNAGRKIKTKIIFSNIDKLLKKGIQCSIICVISKFNANPHKLSKFGLMMIEKGIFSIRFNPAYIPFEDKKKLMVDNETLAKIFETLYDVYMKHSEAKWYPFIDVEKGILGLSGLTCVFSECDIYHTEAETPIFEDGTLGNCLHIGEQWMRADLPSRERYEILQKVNIEYGGCKDCRFWNICKGGCPGSGLNDDWRNRWVFCEAYKKLFEKVEQRFERVFMRTLPFETPKEKTESNKEHGDSHGDSHGNEPHGDAWLINGKWVHRK